MVTVLEINKVFTFCTITKTWLQITCGCWWWDRQCPTGSNLLLSFAHLSPLFLVWGTQKNFAVNNSWNRRESSSYINCGTGSLWTPSVLPIVVVSFFLYTSYSTPTAPVCTACRHRDPQPWGTPSALAASTHGRPITTTSVCVTLKELLQPSRGWDSQTRTVHSCKILLQLVRTTVYSCETSPQQCHACTVFASFLCLVSPSFPPPPPFPPWRPW